MSRKEYINDGNQYISVCSLLSNLPEEGWFEASCGDGSKGERIYNWYIRGIEPPREEGFKRWLLVRRSLTDVSDLQAYICFAPAQTSPLKLISVAGTRWTVEMCFEECKSEVGMDEYEFRSYDGWYRHITFACLALALLTVLSISISTLDTKRFQEYNPSGSSLEAFKKGRNLHV